MHLDRLRTRLLGDRHQYGATETIRAVAAE
jgi:hypothetical protein